MTTITADSIPVGQLPYGLPVRYLKTINIKTHTTIITLDVDRKNVSLRRAKIGVLRKKQTGAQYSEELRVFYCTPNIIRLMRWAGHVARTGTKSVQGFGGGD